MSASEPHPERDAPASFDTVAVAYNKSAGTVSWLVDGKVKFTVDQIGFRLPGRQYMLLDHAGADTSFSPNQLDCGMGMFTLLDGQGPQHEGLVELSNFSGFYFDPELGAPAPEAFFDPYSLDRVASSARAPRSKRATSQLERTNGT